MVNDREALIRAIIAEPEDDALRLVFADWLDEHGEPERAEFIRLQITLVNDPYCPQRTRLLRRERELHARFATAWIQQDGLSPWAKSAVLDRDHQRLRDGRFERGFVDEVMFDSPDEFLAARTLTERTPTRGVRLLSVYTFTPEQRE